MADEPRRSGRATKGQHTKAFEVAEEPLGKRKGKSQNKSSTKSNGSHEPSPAESDEDENIRCICGHYDANEEGRDMICCDTCGAWQHNDCMELPYSSEEVPPEYFCEQCRPDLHEVLLAKIARGEKPWEEAEKKRLQAEEEKKRKKKGGKKGKKGGRPSDVKSEVSEDFSKTPNRELSTDTKNSVRASSQKRKLEEPESAGSAGKSKVRKVSGQEGGPVQQGSTRSNPANTPLKADGAEVGPYESLAGIRKNVAGALVSLFVDQTNIAVRQGSYRLAAGKSARDIGNNLGLAIEHAMYTNLCGGKGDPNEEYKAKFRTMSYNVKQNPALRDRLLVGKLSPKTFSLMSTEAMASEELQQRDAEIKREAEKQHTLLQEDGPRIRRTHKGEEFVDDDVSEVASESIFSAVPRRRESAIDELSPTSGDTLKPNSDSRQNTFNNGHDRWSQSPDRDQPRFGSIDQSASNLIDRGARGTVQADAEIDQLLKDEDNESPPYSPKDFGSDDTVWYGKVSMAPVGTFMATAKHVAGADVSPKTPWNQLLPSSLTVDGRIETSRATDYLCGLRFSQTTEVSVVALNAPDSPDQRANFDKLFDYFTQRKRYGVLGTHPDSLVRDMYLVPVEAGSNKHPEFLGLLENNSVEEPNPARIFLIALIIKKGNTSSQATPSNHGAASPMTAGPTPVGYQATPPAHQTPFPPSSHISPVPGHNATPQPPNYSTPGQPQFPLPQQQTPLSGVKAAEYVLGDKINVPSVQQLLPRLPKAATNEFEIISEILKEVPAANESLDVLLQALRDRSTK